MRVSLSALLGVALAATAQAQEMGGSYMGFALGVLNYEEDVGDFGVTFEDDTTAYRILGGYRFNDNFALEAGWGASSDLKDSFGAVTVSGDYEVLTARALGMIPFDAVSLLGGVGYYDADLTAAGSIPGLGQLVIEDSDSGATLVGGVQFNLERVSIRAELEWFDTDSSIEAWAGSMGVLFRF